MEKTTVGRFTVVIHDDGYLQFWTDYRRPVSESLFWQFLGYGIAHLFTPGLHTPSIALPAPSEVLQSLLRNFHKSRAIMPLLDRMIEEYPAMESHLLPLLTTTSEVAG